MDWTSRPTAYNRNDPALAFFKRSVLDHKWSNISGTAFLHSPVATPGANLLESCAQCLGSICSLRHISPATRTRRILSLQCSAVIDVFWSRIYIGPAGCSDRAINVAGVYSPFQMVSGASGQSADWKVAPLSYHVWLCCFYSYPCNYGYDYGI